MHIGVVNDWVFRFYGYITFSDYDIFDDITGLIMGKLKHDVDSTIVDLIMEHFNTQSFRGVETKLTGKEFDKIVKVAKDMYYLDMIKSVESNMPQS